MGEKTGIAVDFQAAPWGDTLKQVSDGRLPVHAGLFYRKSRDEYLDYGVAMVATDTHVFMHKSLDEPKKLSDLSAFRVGVLAGDVVEEFLKEKLGPDAVVTYPDYESIITDLKQGQSAGFLPPIPPTGVYHLKRSGLIRHYRYGKEQLLYSSDWYVAVTSGRSDLLEIINSGMGLISKSELLQAQRRWLGSSGTARDDDALIVSVAHANAPLSKTSEVGEATALFLTTGNSGLIKPVSRYAWCRAVLTTQWQR